MNSRPAIDAATRTYDKSRRTRSLELVWLPSPQRELGRGAGGEGNRRRTTNTSWPSCRRKEEQRETRCVRGATLVSPHPLPLSPLRRARGAKPVGFLRWDAVS